MRKRFKTRSMIVVCLAEMLAKAFSEKKPLIALNDLMTANDRSDQEGFKFITMGAMSGICNLYSHADIIQMSAVDAVERLAFISMLFKRIDKIDK